MSWLGRLALLLIVVIGLVISLRAAGATGFGEIAAAAARIGGFGFVAYCVWSCVVFVILGAAWRAAAPGPGVPGVARFAWARAVREAAADLLPFSQIGGIVIGARTLAGRMTTARIYASLIVDMTTELASQLGFTLFGILSAATIAARVSGAKVLSPTVLIAVAILAGIVAIFLAAQRWLPHLAGALAQRVLPGSARIIGEIEADLASIYARRAGVLLAFVLNLLAWIASAAGAWIALRLMGVPASLFTMLVLESLIFTLRSVAFAIPGGFGVQEAGYALIAPALGLPLETALALALIKRARDLGLGLPTLILWQLGEIRGLPRQTV